MPCREFITNLTLFDWKKKVCVFDCRQSAAVVAIDNVNRDEMRGKKIKIKYEEKVSDWQA